ncbi:hypothetical protein L1887_26097 [Cichorium endivia]|nr:hypothetical protein L1887_26097 [Cichorium endivia]
MKLKNCNKSCNSKENVDTAKERQSQEQARRKKMSRAQDGILKYMLKMMEVCKAQGFVYGIIPEKGKPVSGASDNLREWWKDKFRFDHNGPAAAAKVQADNITGQNDACPHDNRHPPLPEIKNRFQQILTIDNVKEEQVKDGIDDGIVEADDGNGKTLICASTGCKMKDMILN